MTPHIAKILSLVQRQFVLNHTINRNEISALLLFCQNVVSIKILLVLTFSYKPNMLKFRSTEDGQDFFCFL
jgi:hypothetical protein